MDLVLLLALLLVFVVCFYNLNYKRKTYINSKTRYKNCLLFENNTKKYSYHKGFIYRAKTFIKKLNYTEP